MALYRKRPVVIEANRLDDENIEAVAMWCGGRTDRTDRPFCIEIPTREGIMTAYPGDWIIKGVADEFYPCGNKIFQATYDPVEAMA